MESFIELSDLLEESPKRKFLIKNSFPDKIENNAMGYDPTNEGTIFVKNLIKYDFLLWYLLLLPDGKWAAFWHQGLDTCFSEAIFDGNYESVCAFIGNKRDTIEYILTSLHQHNLEDPLNFNFQIDKIRKNLYRANSRLKKFPD